MRRTIAPFILAALIVGSAGSPAFAQATIERIAPDNSVLIIGSKKVQALLDHVKQTPLWSLWQSDEIKAMRAEAMEETGKGMKEMYQELGVEEGSLAPPTGPAGLAVYSVLNEETAASHLALLALADYGDEASAEKMHALIQAAIARGVEDDLLKMEEKDAAGRTVFALEFAAPEEEPAGDEEMGFNPMMPDLSTLLGDSRTVHYLRDGNRLILGTDFASLTAALERLDDEAAEGISKRKDFRAATDKLGEPDVYMVVLTRDIMELIGAADPMGMAQMLRPTIRTLFGQVDSYGVGMRADGPTAMLEQVVSVYMPNGKQGLSALLDQPAPRGKAPAFAGAQSVSYSTFNFQFSGLMDVIRKTVASNPILQMQAGEMLPMIEAGLLPLTNALGKTVHISSDLSRPITLESQHSVVAIEVTKPQALEEALAGLAEQAGFEQRDFLGQSVWSMDPAAMGITGPTGEAPEPISLGVGGGFLLLGPTPGVEQALRSTGQPAQASLSAVKGFDRAVATLPNEPVVAWGWSDTIAVVEAATVNQRLMMEKSLAEIREFDPEFAAEVEQDMKDSKGLFESLNFDLLRRYIGPSAWAVRSVEDGFVIRSYLLSAGE